MTSRAAHDVLTRYVGIDENVFGHVDEDVEVARRAAAQTGLTLAREADTGAGFDARGDIDRERLFLLHPARAAAGLARVLDDLTGAGTGRAGAFDGEEALLGAPLAMAAAMAAGCRLRPRLGARAGRAQMP